MGRLLTRNDFLQRAHEVHGDKYDYTNTVYINNRHKIDVCCPIHGVFTQLANIHLQGNMSVPINVQRWRQQCSHLHNRKI